MPAAASVRRAARAAALAFAAAVAGAAALLAAPAAAAGAVRCPAPAGADASLAGIDGRARLEWIDARLTRTGDRARLWTWGWGLGIGASGVASLVAVPFVSRDSRVDWYTSAASAAVGVIPFLLSPLDVTSDAPALHAKVAAASSSDASVGAPDDVCPLLADAEALLVRNARNQRVQRSWWVHAGNLAFNTGVTLFLGLGFHHWEAGLINGVAGAAVGEAIIFSQPAETIDDLDVYRAGMVTAAAPVKMGWGYGGRF